MKKKLICLLLALVVLLSNVPAMAGWVTLSMRQEELKEAFQDYQEFSGSVQALNGANQTAGETGLDVVILIDRSGSMPKTDPNEIALAATKMFIDRCNAQDNSVAVVTYGYSILTNTDFYDLSRAGSVDELRGKVEESTIKDTSNDTNTGMALEHVYDKIAQRKASFPNHKFAILVISDGKIDIKSCEEFQKDTRYPDKGEQTQKKLIEESKKAGLETAEQCRQDSIPIYCLGVYSNQEGGNILEPDMQSWSNTTGGLYREEDDINEVYNIVREFYLHMTGNPAPMLVTDGEFTIPDNVLEANVEIVPAVEDAKDRMTLKRNDNSLVDLSGGDPSVKVREDDQYTMIKLNKPEPGDWKLTFADGIEHNLNVYVTYNLDLSMMITVPETAVNGTQVPVTLTATKQKVPYYDPNHPAKLTIRHADTNTEYPSVDMTWNAAAGQYEYTFMPNEVGTYRFKAEIVTQNMTNIGGTDAVLHVTERPVKPNKDLDPYTFSGHLISCYQQVEHVPDLRSYFDVFDKCEIQGYKVETSPQGYVQVTADTLKHTLTYTAQRDSGGKDIEVKVCAIDNLGRTSDPIIGTVKVEDAQADIELNSNVPVEPIMIKAMLPQPSGVVVLTGLENYFVEPNAKDNEYIASITAAERDGSDLVEEQVYNNTELMLRGLEAGETIVGVTATSSDGSTVCLNVTVEVENMLMVILMFIGGGLLLIALIALVIWLVVQANKPVYSSMASLTITLCDDTGENDGTDMLRKYGKRKVKLSEVCRKAGMYTGSFGATLDKITISPKKNGIFVQCALKNIPQKEFTMHPYDTHSIDADPVTASTIKLEYYEAD